LLDDQKNLHAHTQSVWNLCKEFASIFLLLVSLTCSKPDSLLLLQSVTDFLKGLPSYNESNFTKYHNDGGIRNNAKRPSVYLPTVDHPSDQSKASKYAFN
jgi:Det1 complexing ubiquitin ligase